MLGMPPERIVSLAPSNTEILYAIGKGEQVVGVTAFCDYPEQAKEKTKVGGWTKINMDKVKALNPDLCATSTFLQAPIADELQAEGFSVFHVNPFNLEDVLYSMVSLSKAAGVPDQGKLLSESIRLELSDIGFSRQTDTVKPKMFVLEWNNPLTVSGNWVPDLVEIAGAEPVLARKGKPSYTVSFDKLLDTDPDLIIVSLCGRGMKADPQKVFYNSELQRLTAFKSKSIYILDDSLLTRPGPRIIEGAKKLTECIDDWKTRNMV
jgi:iron complex transport system substrate-binding protein